MGRGPSRELLGSLSRGQTWEELGLVVKTKERGPGRGGRSAERPRSSRGALVGSEPPQAAAGWLVRKGKRLKEGALVAGKSGNVALGVVLKQFTILKKKLDLK